MTSNYGDSQNVFQSASHYFSDDYHHNANTLVFATTCAVVEI